MNETAIDTATLAGPVAAEQVQMVYRHLPAAILPPIFAGALIAYLLRDRLPHAQLWLWLLWVALSYVFLPSVLCLAYRRARDPDSDPLLWGRRYALMALFTASSWGAAGILLFVPGDPLYQIFLGCVMFTGTVSVLATTFAYTPAYYAGAIPMLAPLAAGYVAAGESMHYVMAGVVVMLFIMLAYFQRSMCNSLTQSISLRHERERLIGELERKSREIEAASQAKSRFLAATSHDLRQPLHAQRLFLSELEANVRDAKNLGVISRIWRSMESMDALLGDLMDIARLDAGAVEIHKTAFQLMPLLAGIECEFAAQMAEKRLRFRVSHCRHVVYSDPMLLERILRNLVHNAVRYTPSGAVLVVCRKRDRMVEIQIRDSGPGIPAGQQSQIFEEFTQLGNSERNRNKGLGLGLAIVARLARLLGHEVEVRSRPDMGSVFAIRVPLSDQAPPMASPTRAQAGVSADISGLRVWVVDDDPEIIQAMSLLLERWGCQARLMTDMAQVLEILPDACEYPDVVIADYRLPGSLSGLDLIGRIRDGAGERVAAVLITGDTSPTLLNQARASDCILLHKPVDAMTLHSLLCNLCRQ